ncbi:MAG: four-carbon acid sugar kinase family protein [Nibricoccus sp.]
MASSSFTVLADDITGAAELAAIGNRCGLPTRIFSPQANTTAFTGLSVYDSDTRLLSPADAAGKVAKISRSIIANSPGFVYKKTDSVLRGNVVAECAALAAAVGKKRVLLVPANPSLGRTISKGQYFVNGLPIDQTAFARDPHHPARSANVIDLLGRAEGWPISVTSVGSPAAKVGIMVGEAASSADVTHWARQLDDSTLPAGGAEFFKACLTSKGYVPEAQPDLTWSGPTLVLSGSLTPARETLVARAAGSGWQLEPMPQSLVLDAGSGIYPPRWQSSLAQALRTRRLAIATSPGVSLHDMQTAEKIREAFGKLVKRLLAEEPLAHLIVEGGATAAAISEANGWTSFDVAGEWAPGVIALRPVQKPTLLFTIKPGSYAWPENLFAHLATGTSSTKSSL